ncbi:MarR family winged helix-turn-helix transcriptional regulator [Asticcacaulis sp. W401b]|uniref:MarR family winged helix-turn-helix transcriptional regulator n=1 Tax=Asticcacaulis sp. W401b TaxID=3388666 RepID=UPI0039705C81
MDNESFVHLLEKMIERWDENLFSELSNSGFQDVRPAHLAVLRALNSEGARATDIAQSAGIKKQSIAYLVADLSNLGYVRIEVEPQDARAKRIYLTERGLALQVSILSVGRTFEHWSESIVGADRFRAMRHALALIAIEYRAGR